MALIFHEGIPGCGKTYEAVAKHLIPALKKGRHVFARIDGLNHEQLAQLAGITVERCQDLLQVINEDQVKSIDTLEVPIGSLFMIDEIQNYFPDTRAKLSDGVTKFVAEQRHKGLDIVAMGQDLKDVHKIWRRRVDQKVLFHKLDMLGSAKYRWKLFKAVGPEKFKEVSAGTEEYDKAIFGAYKSFEAGAEGAQKYDDKRASIWSSALFRRVLPIVAIVGVVAIYYVVQLFRGGGLEKSLHGASAAPKTASVQVAPSSTGRGGAAPAVGPQLPSAGEKKDFIGQLCDKYRLRVSGVVRRADKLAAVFEWYDEALHVKERMTVETVHHLGYQVRVFDSMDAATLTKDGVVYIATQFPLETFGRVSDARQEQIAGAGGKVH